MKGSLSELFVGFKAVRARAGSIWPFAVGCAASRRFLKRKQLHVSEQAFPFVIQLFQISGMQLAGNWERRI